VRQTAARTHCGGTPEHRRLAALRDRRQQVDHLDAGLEQIDMPAAIRKLRRRALDRPLRRIRGQGRTAVTDTAADIDQAAQHVLAHRNRQGFARGLHLSPARNARSGAQSHTADRGGVEVALHLHQQRLSQPGRVYPQRRFERRQLARSETHVDDGATHGAHGSDGGIAHAGNSTPRHPRHLDRRQLRHASATKSPQPRRIGTAHRDYPSVEPLISRPDRPVRKPVVVLRREPQAGCAAQAAHQPLLGTSLPPNAPQGA